MPTVSSFTSPLMPEPKLNSPEESEIVSAHHTPEIPQAQGEQANFHDEQPTVDLVKVNSQLQAEIASRLEAQRALQESQFCLRLINAIATGRISGLSTEQIIERTLNQIHQFFHDLRITYSTIDEYGHAKVTQAIALLEVPLAATELDLNITPGCLNMLRQGEPMIASDVSQEILLQPLAHILHTGQTQAWLAVPLRHSEGLVGLLSLQAPQPRLWSEYEIGTLMEIADYLSFALQEAYAQEERKKAEIALIKANEELEQRVKERTMALVEANQKLEKEIEERKLAEIALKKSQERLELSQKIGSIGTFELDLQNQDITWTEELEALYGYEPGSFSGSNDDWFAILHPEDRIKVQEADMAAIQDKKDLDLEFRIFHPVKGIRWMAEKARIFYNEIDGKPIRMIGVHMDITERKQAEEEMRQALEKEREVSELRSRIVTTVSHEFRTPLATILLSTEILERQKNKLTDSQKQQRIYRIKNAVNQMIELLDDTLLLSRADAGKQEFTPEVLDVQKLCLEVVDEIKALQSPQTNHATNIEFISECISSQAYLDEKLLRQIINNLVSNAVKYSPQGGTVNFYLSCQTNLVILKVQDEGIGIPSSDLTHLFEPFHRASNVGAIQGTGLGLAISKRSVELHGGQIAVDTEVAKGTTFTVTLPFQMPV